jgi:hypothetical protein
VLVGLSACMAAPVHAQPSPKGDPKQNEPDFAALEKPAVFELAPTSGSLKESVQKGQELNWRLKDKPAQGAFQLTNVSIGLLRTETGGQLLVKLGCNISSLGYQTTEAKLSVIIRTKGGAALHGSEFIIPVKCTDKNQPLPPQTSEVPKEIVTNVFNNASTLEIVEQIEPNSPGLPIQRCG